MRADVAHARGGSGDGRVGAPYGLLHAVGLQPGGQPALGILDDDASDRSQLAGGYKLPRFLDHRVAGVVVGKAEELAGLSDLALQLPGLGQVHRHGLVADDVESGVQGGYGHGEVRAVGRYDGDEVHPLLRRQRGLRLQHLLVGAIDSLRGQQKVLSAEPGLLRRAAEGPADELDLVVHLGRDAVDGAYEGVPPAAHHAHPEFSVQRVHAELLLPSLTSPSPPPPNGTGAGVSAGLPGVRAG